MMLSIRSFLARTLFQILRHDQVARLGYEAVSLLASPGPESFSLPPREKAGDRHSKSSFSWAIRCLFIVITLLICPRPLMAQCEEDQILPFDGMPGDGFGKSVAIDGNVAIIGTRFDDSIGRPGAVYIYRFDGVSWNPEAKLQPEDVGRVDLFGSVVSIHGDVAVVGSYADDDLGYDSGSAYVFRFNGQEWIEEAHLFAPDGDERDHFGRAVDVYGDYIAIGASWDDTFRPFAGAVYLYHYGEQGWERFQIIGPPIFTNFTIRFGVTLQPCATGIP